MIGAIKMALSSLRSNARARCLAFLALTATSETYEMDTYEHKPQKLKIVTTLNMMTPDLNVKTRSS